MELLTLLLIAAAVTTALGLLIAGFVYVPWLIALVLIGLLVALTRVSRTQSALSSSKSLSNSIATPLDLSETPASRDKLHPSPHPEVSPNEPVAHFPTPLLSYRGARYY